MSFADTIFALSTAAGKAGVAVIRISGSQAATVYDHIINLPKPTANIMRYCHFIDPKTREIIDFGLTVYFPSPASFTGEDCVEFHGHGGLATIQALLNILNKTPNFRHAEAGEFSRRGFMNGKFDLTQAESTIDLIDAETEHQRRAALSHSRGALHKLYEGWWQELSTIRAYTEACLDFPDEELPDDLEDHIRQSCRALYTEIAQHHQTAPQGERLRMGTKVAIIGPSNAGKSSLLNYLSQSKAAIISPIAGTTRDTLEKHIDIAGYPVRIIDTAGIQETHDPIEQEGIRRAGEQAEIADIIIVMFDGSKAIDNKEYFRQYTENTSTILLMNKSDIGYLEDNNIIEKFIENAPIHISLSNGTGLENLTENLTNLLKTLAGNSHAPIIMHARYQQALYQTMQALENVMQLIKTTQENKIDIDLVLIAEELRLGMSNIARIIGKVDVEDLLEIIFSRFCIGK